MPRFNTIPGTRGDPMKQIRRVAFVCILALVITLPALFNPLSAHADFSNLTTVATGPFIQGSYYNYAPSIIRTGTLEQIWWCGAGSDNSPTPNPNHNSDTIQYETYDTSTNQFSSQQEVLWQGNNGSWDSYAVCDPSVIGGSFVDPDNQQAYSLAMYYTSTDDNTNGGIDNRIGVAFSNDGVNWDKYSGNPVIYPSTFPTSQYGAGQAATYNGDGKAGLRIFYTDTTGQSSNGTSGTYFRSTTDGIHFGAATRIVSTGIGIPTPLTAFNGGDFAFDYHTSSWYLIVGDASRPGDIEAYQDGLYRISESDLVNGTGSWQPLGFINTNLNGYHLNLQPGIVRDKFGNVTPFLPSITIITAGGTGGNFSNWNPHLVMATWNSSPSTLPFKRYYNPGTNTHWVSTGYVASGYNYEGTPGYLFMAPQGSNMQALYGCITGGEGGNDHYISTDGTCGGNDFLLGVNGWLYSSQPSGISTVALYQCNYAGHFVTTDPNCEGGHGTGVLLGYAPTSP